MNLLLISNVLVCVYFIVEIKTLMLKLKNKQYLQISIISLFCCIFLTLILTWYFLIIYSLFFFFFLAIVNLFRWRIYSYFNLLSWICEQIQIKLAFSLKCIFLSSSIVNECFIVYRSLHWHCGPLKFVKHLSISSGFTVSILNSGISPIGGLYLLLGPFLLILLIFSLYYILVVLITVYNKEFCFIHSVWCSGVFIDRYFLI